MADSAYLDDEENRLKQQLENADSYEERRLLRQKLRELRAKKMDLPASDREESVTVSNHALGGLGAMGPAASSLDEDIDLERCTTEEELQKLLDDIPITDIGKRRKIRARLRMIRNGELPPSSSGNKERPVADTLDSAGHHGNTSHTGKPPASSQTELMESSAAAESKAYNSSYTHQTGLDCRHGGPNHSSLGSWDVSSLPSSMTHGGHIDSTKKQHSTDAVTVQLSAGIKNSGELDDWRDLQASSHNAPGTDCAPSQYQAKTASTVNDGSGLQLSVRSRWQGDTTNAASINQNGGFDLISKNPVWVGETHLEPITESSLSSAPVSVDMMEAWSDPLAGHGHQAESPSSAADGMGVVSKIFSTAVTLSVGDLDVDHQDFSIPMATAVEGESASLFVHIDMDSGMAAIPVDQIPLPPTDTGCGSVEASDDDSYTSSSQTAITTGHQEENSTSIVSLSLSGVQNQPGSRRGSLLAKDHSDSGGGASVAVVMPGGSQKKPGVLAKQIPTADAGTSLVSSAEAELMEKLVKRSGALGLTKPSLRPTAASAALQVDFRSVLKKSSSTPTQSTGSALKPPSATPSAAAAVEQQDFRTVLKKGPQSETKPVAGGTNPPPPQGKVAPPQGAGLQSSKSSVTTPSKVPESSTVKNIPGITETSLKRVEGKPKDNGGVADEHKMNTLTQQNPRHTTPDKTQHSLTGLLPDQSQPARIAGTAPASVAANLTSAQALSVGGTHTFKGPLLSEAKPATNPPPGVAVKPPSGVLPTQDQAYRPSPRAPSAPIEVTLSLGSSQAPGAVSVEPAAIANNTGVPRLASRPDGKADEGPSSDLLGMIQAKDAEDKAKAKTHPGMRTVAALTSDAHFEALRQQRAAAERKKAAEAKNKRMAFVQKLESSAPKLEKESINITKNNTNLDRLLKWCQNMTADYENVCVEDFSSSWADGMALCALLHNFVPHRIPFHQLNPKNRRENFDTALRVAGEEGVPDILDLEDLCAMKSPDSKSMATYLSCIYQTLVAGRQ